MVKDIIRTIVYTTGARSIPDRLNPNNGPLIRRYLRAEGQKKLHLGCGTTRVLDGWLNTDIRTSSIVAYVDVTKRFPFPDSSFDYVFSEHMIEHIPYGKACYMLRESLRVLRPGGKIRLVTPDFEFLKQLHRENKSDLQKAYIAWAVDSFGGRQCGNPDMFVINNFFRNWGHEFIYDGPAFRDVLEKAGFVSITPQELGKSDDPALSGLEYEERMPAGFLRLESMVLEAVKPA